MSEQADWRDPEVSQDAADVAFEAEMSAISQVYSLRPGHTLSQEDFDAIQAYDKAMRRDEERVIDVFHRGYQQGLREGGSADIAKLKNERDEAKMRLTVANALRKADRPWLFRNGARNCREMLARFVEQGGDATTAASIRANWHPGWGDDPGPPEDIAELPALDDEEPADV